ncbi:MAG TPA: type II toxin-antitoxin system VapC family toxin [Desulfobacterales bacterium]
MITSMLDTNIRIYIIKKKPPAVLERFKKSRLSQMKISTITVSELLYGAHKSSQPQKNKIALTQFLAPLEIVAYDDTAAHVYGKIRVHLERKGTPIGALDMLIAAHALSLSCRLVTNNESEFRRVPGLDVENWT